MLTSTPRIVEETEADPTNAKSTSRPTPLLASCTNTLMLSCSKCVRSSTNSAVDLLLVVFWSSWSACNATPMPPNDAMTTMGMYEELAVCTNVEIASLEIVYSRAV